MKCNKMNKLAQRCVLLLVVGFIMSFLTVIAFATTTTSSKYSFYCGSTKYTNYAQLSIEDNDGVAWTTIGADYTWCDPGYLGVNPRIYKETSSGAGTYYLIEAGAWTYNTDSAGAYSASSIANNLSSGDYMAQGQTAVYYNGAYQYKYTHITPFINVY